VSALRLDTVEIVKDAAPKTKSNIL